LIQRIEQTGRRSRRRCAKSHRLRWAQWLQNAAHNVQEDLMELTLKRLALCFVVVVAGAGCGGAASGASTGDDQAATEAKKGGVTDEQLAAELAAAPAAFTPADASRFINDTVFPVATTKRFTILNDFIRDRLAKEPKGSDNVDAVAFDMEGVFW